MPNKELAYTVLDDIKNSRFSWDQHVWVYSRILSSPVTENECGTSYCFAGRVASLSDRKQLYETGDILQMKKTRDEVRASGYFTALPGETPDMRLTRNGYVTASPGTNISRTWRADRSDRFYVAEDGKFVRYYGDVVHAAGAAARDLRITMADSDRLFSAHRDLPDLIDGVNEIFGEKEEA